MTVQRFGTGAVRDEQGNKPRLSLVPPDFILEIAMWCTAGAVKYSADNWKKGIPLHRIYDSLGRHLLKWQMGMNDENHLIAVAWNIMALWWTEKRALKGELPGILLTAGPYQRFSIEEYEAWEADQGEHKAS